MQQLRVQLIDPDLVAQRRLAEYLRAAGLDVQIASDGAGAVAPLRRNAPAVLILDPMAASCKALIGYCRRDARLKAVPVLLLSGEPNLGRAVQELGALAGLAKPIDLDILLAVILRVAAVRDPVQAQAPGACTWSAADPWLGVPIVLSGCTGHLRAARIRGSADPSSGCGQLPRRKLWATPYWRLPRHRSIAPKGLHQGP